VKRYEVYYKDEADDGEWVLYEDAQVEIAQLRGTLSLAEEGLANYAQELAQIKRSREQERDYADVCYESEGLRQRCMALAYLLYPTSEPPRVAIDGDLGLCEPQSEPISSK
jgi:hypothetical protein